MIGAPSTYTQRQLWIILGSLMLGTVLSAIDTSIVSTALPTIAGELGGFESYAWVGTSYILTSTIATPILGKLGDLYGRRRLILVTIWIFTLGSLVCGLAQTMPQLIAARSLQGLGGGGIQALTFAIIGDLVSPRERGRYMGLYTGIYAAAAVVGPLLGGWMIGQFAWPWIFLVNVPVALVAIVAIMRTLKIQHVSHSTRIDFLGAFLLSVFLASLVIALQEGRNGWTRGLAPLLLVVAAAALAAFLLQEQRSPEPLVPLALFRMRIFATGGMMGFVAGAMSFGVTGFLPLQFQDANFVDPTRAGLYLIPLMVGIMVGSAYGGRLISKTGRYRFVPVSALTVSVLGTAAMSRIAPSTPYWMLIIPMIFIGTGNGATFTTTSIATQNAIDPRMLGIGTATLVSLRSLGGSLALAGYGAIFTSTVNRGLRSHLPPGSLPAGKPVSSLIREPATIRELPTAVRDVVVQSITHATSRVFLFAVPLVALGLVLAITLPERPLKTTAGGGAGV
jgi:EmrB/QacA subfamily drug resistance transporter